VTPLPGPPRQLHWVAYAAACPAPHKQCTGMVHTAAYPAQKQLHWADTAQYIAGQHCSTSARKVICSPKACAEELWDHQALAPGTQMIRHPQDTTATPPIHTFLHGVDQAVLVQSTQLS